MHQMLKAQPFTKCNAQTPDRSMILRTVSLLIPLCRVQLGTDQVSASSSTETLEITEFLSRRGCESFPGGSFPGGSGEHRTGEVTKVTRRGEGRPGWNQSPLSTQCLLPYLELNLVAQRCSRRTEIFPNCSEKLICLPV